MWREYAFKIEIFSENRNYFAFLETIRHLFNWNNAFCNERNLRNYIPFFKLRPRSTNLWLFHYTKIH